MHIESFIVDASIFAASSTRDVAFSVALNQNSSPRFAVEGLGRATGLCSSSTYELLSERRRRTVLNGWVLSSLSVCETSYEGHMVDALASRAEEGRRSLR